MNSQRSGDRRRSWRVMTSRRGQWEAISFPPPLPGSRRRIAPGTPICVELMLPYRSIWAPPRKPRSISPRCSRHPSTSRSDPSRTAWYMTFGSETEIGVGRTRGAITPLSMTQTTLGACVRCANVVASSGSPVPTNTTSPSRTWRAASMTMSSWCE